MGTHSVAVLKALVRGRVGMYPEVLLRHVRQAGESADDLPVWDDYHLRSYQVAEFGRLITLDLVYDYPGQAVRESQIQFQGVKLYHFVHTTGSIITDIDEVSLERLLAEFEGSITAWARDLGVADWRTDIQQLLRDWSALSLKAWSIDSAIGFKGFVVATSVT